MWGCWLDVVSDGICDVVGYESAAAEAHVVGGQCLAAAGVVGDVRGHGVLTTPVCSAIST